MVLAASLAPLPCLGCGHAPSDVGAHASRAGGEAETRGNLSIDARTVLRYHSARFKLSVPLPEGREWRIDDHSRPELVAIHAATGSRLTVYSFAGPELMNRRSCEARARDNGLFTLRDPRTVADEATVGPDAYDSRVWIALEAGASSASALTGHAFLFGAYVRKCLFVHYVTSVPSASDEPVLTSRLATARLLILAGVRLEPFDQSPRVQEATP